MWPLRVKMPTQNLLRLLLLLVLMLRSWSLVIKTNFCPDFARKILAKDFEAEVKSIFCCWPLAIMKIILGRDSEAMFSLPRFPDPLAFGSGSGLQCVYTVVISLWGTPAAKFVLESPKTLFYWIPLCIRKPQAQFQKFSSTHGSPSDRFISSPRSPLLVGIKD